ncbi:MAG: bifunctional riboflavin kinase/FAD synthetase [Candidatus Schekmanbacteria bacterium]|nr:MAG: bifunctional riboflavin kinase/FAD synthetase [Candidatus Schekmanbacteria bacterium]
MKLIRGVPDRRLDIKKSVVTIGNFDGIHLGHQEIFNELLETSRSLDGKSVVISFHPHPLKILSPEKCPPLINTIREKIELISRMGIDYLVCIRFSKEFSEIEPEKFIKEILIDRIGMKKLLVGYDFGFGRGRSGSIDFIKENSKKLGYEVKIIEPLKLGDVIVSSTLIRNLVLEGKVERAKTYLGRPFSIRGRVVEGAKRGRKLNFPTANISTFNKIIPPNGVYIAETLIDGVKYPSLVNVGTRPTFQGRGTLVESYLLDFNRDIYGKFIRVFFLHYIREEMKFKNEGELKARMHEDLKEAKNFFNIKMTE